MLFWACGLYGFFPTERLSNDFKVEWRAKKVRIWVLVKALQTELQMLKTIRTIAWMLKAKHAKRFWALKQRVLHELKGQEDFKNPWVCSTYGWNFQRIISKWGYGKSQFQFRLVVMCKLEGGAIESSLIPNGELTWVRYKRYFTGGYILTHSHLSRRQPHPPTIHSVVNHVNSQNKITKKMIKKKKKKDTKKKKKEKIKDTKMRTKKKRQEEDKIT